MRVLLDTQILIWAIDRPTKLNSRIKEILNQSEVYLSTISIYEILLKRKIGKLDFTEKFEDLIRDEVFIPLDLNYKHSLATYDLPLIHRDPFDRMLIAQSIVEKIPLITSDKMIQQYDFKFISG